MTPEGFYGMLGEVAERITGAEGALRRAAAKAPTRAGREDALAAADTLSAERRRLRAVTARAHEGRAASTPPRLRERVEVGALEIDPATREVTVGGEAIRLAKKEFELLVALAAEPTRVWTKAELLREVWDYRSLNGVRTRTLDSHASRLRRKLNGAPDRHFVVNCWGVGYRLVDELSRAVDG